jgi:hypothetical protein
MSDDVDIVILEQLRDWQYNVLFYWQSHSPYFVQLLFQVIHSLQMLLSEEIGLAIPNLSLFSSLVFNDDKDL